jgi:hypothetical protein|tara:strand:- start:213 stop:1142 length:930 start_codon:yes stop_codon:yes gene_type:complete
MVPTIFSDIKMNLSQRPVERVSHDYRDSNKTPEEQIELEKRRRHQIYMLLDYVLSVVTYFDFFSHDTFTIVKRAKYWAAACKRPFVNGEFLLLPFLDSEFEFSNILKEYGLKEDNILSLIKKANNIPKPSLWQETNFYFYNLFEQRFDIFLNPLITKNIKYAYETRVIFEKAAENALTRFKTPVITPEILFITMMEQKTAKVSKLIKRFFPEETGWYLFRYRLIKRIHYQEVSIRSLVPKNEQYFAYLLKINLPEYEFNRLVDMELLNLGVTTFRNRLIRHLLTLNLFDLLEKDINKSIKVTNTRKYST